MISLILGLKMSEIFVIILTMSKRSKIFEIEISDLKITEYLILRPKMP